MIVAEVPATKRALDQLAARFNGALADTTSEIEKERAAFEELERGVRRFTWRRAVRQARTLRRAATAQRTEVSEALEDLARTKRTFEEFMKIKAPVDYWAEKAAQHRSRANNYSSYLILFALEGSILLVAGLYWLSAHAVQLAQAERPPAVYLILVTLGVVSSTIVFWAARILVRLFMSEHHLAIDADERATMAMTYLALTEKGAAEEKDRAIVLASLFRPTSNGIVKDDAAPDFGPGALLSKALDRQP